MLFDVTALVGPFIILYLLCITIKMANKKQHKGRIVKITQDPTKKFLPTIGCAKALQLNSHSLILSEFLVTKL